MGHANVFCFCFLQGGVENLGAKCTGVTLDCLWVLTGGCATGTKDSVQPCAVADFISCKLKTHNCAVWISGTLLGFVARVLLLSRCHFSSGVF